MGKWFRTNSLMIAAATFFVAVAVFLLFLFDQWDIYSVDANTSGDKIVAAVLGVIGLTVSAVLSLLGIGIKKSLDERREGREQDAEKRRSIDVSIRAAELMGGGAYGKPSPELAAGALLALTNLGELRFALSLLPELWRKDHIGTPNAIWLVEKIFKAGDLPLKRNAANELSYNATKLAERPDILHMPEPFADQWAVEGFDLETRSRVLFSMLKALLSKEFAYWESSVLTGMVVTTLEIAEKDTDDGIKHTGALACNYLVTA